MDRKFFVIYIIVVILKKEGEMLNAEDKEKIRDDVRNYFIEINKNIIPKKNI